MCKDVPDVTTMVSETPAVRVYSNAYANHGMQILFVLLGILLGLCISGGAFFLFRRILGSKTQPNVTSDIKEAKLDTEGAEKASDSVVANVTRLPL